MWDRGKHWDGWEVEFPQLGAPLCYEWEVANISDNHSVFLFSASLACNFKTGASMWIFTTSAMKGKHFQKENIRADEIHTITCFARLDDYINKMTDFLTQSYNSNWTETIAAISISTPVLPFK